MRRTHAAAELALVLLATLAAFGWGAAAARAERGYDAAGGEYLLLLLPLLYYIIKKIAMDWIEEIQALRRGGRK